MDFLNAALGDDTTSEVNGSDSTQDVGYEVGESNVYRGQRMMNAVTRSCLLPVKAKGAVRLNARVYLGPANLGVSAAQTIDLAVHDVATRAVCENAKRGATAGSRTAALSFIPSQPVYLFHGFEGFAGENNGAAAGTRPAVFSTVDLIMSSGRFDRRTPERVLSRIAQMKSGGRRANRLFSPCRCVSAKARTPSQQELAHLGKLIWDDVDYFVEYRTRQTASGETAGGLAAYERVPRKVQGVSVLTQLVILVDLDMLHQACCPPIARTVMVRGLPLSSSAREAKELGADEEELLQQELQQMLGPYARSTDRGTEDSDGASGGADRGERGESGEGEGDRPPRFAPVGFGGSWRAHPERDEVAYDPSVEAMETREDAETSGASVTQQTVATVTRASIIAPELAVDIGLDWPDGEDGEPEAFAYATFGTAETARAAAAAIDGRTLALTAHASAIARRASRAHESESENAAHASAIARRESRAHESESEYGSDTDWAGNSNNSDRSSSPRAGSDRVNASAGNISDGSSDDDGPSVNHGTLRATVVARKPVETTSMRQLAARSAAMLADQHESGDALVAAGEAADEAARSMWEAQGSVGSAAMAGSAAAHAVLRALDACPQAVAHEAAVAIGAAIERAGPMWKATDHDRRIADTTQPPTPCELLRPLPRPPPPRIVVQSSASAKENFVTAQSIAVEWDIPPHTTWSFTTTCAARLRWRKRPSQESMQRSRAGQDSLVVSPVEVSRAKRAMRWGAARVELQGDGGTELKLEALPHPARLSRRPDDAQAPVAKLRNSALIIRELEPDTSYEITIAYKNSFGWSEASMPVVERTLPL